MKRNYDFSKGVTIKGTIKSKKQIENAITENEKQLTSIRLDKDIIDYAKKKAKEEHIGYLTWINKQLRKIILGDTAIEDRLKKLEDIVLVKKSVKH